MFRGQEIQPIIKKIFGDVKNYLSGEQVQVNCPVCQEREGLLYPDDKYNLEINTSKRVFRCWKCDSPPTSGSLGRLIKMYGSNVDYQLYKDYGGQFADYQHNKEDEEDYDEISYIELPQEMILFSKMDTANPEHLKAYSYLIVERKLTNEQILKYRLGFCIHGKYAGRIIIPSYDKEGGINYFVSRAFWKNIDRPYMNPKIDKDKIIFNEGYINWDSTLYLVEGVFDGFSLPNNVPLLGKTISSALFLKLREKKPNIVILLDNDAYYSNAIKIFNLISTIYKKEDKKVKIIKLNYSNLDIDEIRRKYGKSEVIKILRSSRVLTNEDYIIKKYTKHGKNFHKKGK